MPEMSESGSRCCSDPAAIIAIVPTCAQNERMIALLMLQLATTNVPPLQKDVSEKLAGLFTIYDYPAEALKNEWEGDVSVMVRVGADGLAHSCRIIQTSGYPVLDHQTCAVMFGRARFTPARDKNGHAVEDDFVLPAIRWRIEKSTEAN